MNGTATIASPVRAAIFTNIQQAQRAVGKLPEAGFRQPEITVVCSNEVKEQHFRAFEHQKQAGTNTPAAATVGGAIGATLFGLSAVAAGAATGGVPLAIAGGWALMTGGLAGGFLGAMLTRGLEKEAADYYDQAVSLGKILVAVEIHGSDAARRLAMAWQILREAGSEPVPLPEG